MMTTYLINAACGMMFIEGFGYFYHRWLEHGRALRWFPNNAWLKKLTIRHAIHHNKIYPPTNLRPEKSYETQDLLSWYLPGALITVGVVTLLPWSFAIPFAIGGWAYGLSVDMLHRMFHKPRHFLAKNRVFLEMQRIHDIHHVDQRYNFTIIVPVLDVVGRSFSKKLRSPVDG